MLVLEPWVVLALAGRGVPQHFGVTAIASLGVLLPLGSMLRLPGLFAPGAFVLPGPLGLSLGQVLGLASVPCRALRDWAVAIVVALLFPVLTAGMWFGTSPDFLPEPRPGGWASRWCSRFSSRLPRGPRSV